MLCRQRSIRQRVGAGEVGERETLGNHGTQRNGAARAAIADDRIVAISPIHIRRAIEPGVGGVDPGARAIGLRGTGSIGIPRQRSGNHRQGRGRTRHAAGHVGDDHAVTGRFDLATSRATQFALIVTTAAVLFFGIYPTPLIDYTKAAILQIP